MKWWKFMFDTKTPTWQAYGRAVFVQAETEDEALTAARAAALLEYPGAEIRDVAIGQSTAEAAEAFADKKRRLAEWQANTRTGTPNTRATLSTSPASEATAPQEAEKAIRQLSPRSKAVDVLAEYDDLGRIAVNAVAEFVGPASARVIAARLTPSSSHVAASGSQWEGAPVHALVPLPDAAAICECGSTMVCPDIGCDRHKGAAPPFPFQPSAGITPQAVQGGEGSFPASVEAITSAQNFCSRLLDVEVSGDQLTAYEEQAIDIIKALLVLCVPSPEAGQE
jgi:hypothetical protein